MILTPYGKIPGGYPSEITGSIGPAHGQYLCPQDPQHNTAGEAGFYPDTPLGYTNGGNVTPPNVIAQGPVPSDFQTASSVMYTPVVRGWVATKEGFIQGPYYPQPPGGMNYPMSPQPLGSAGKAKFSIRRALGLGDASSVAATAAAAATMPGYVGPDMAAQAAEDAYRKNVTFWLSVVSTSVIGASALFAIFRAAKGLRHDQLLRQALEKKLL